MTSGFVFYLTFIIIFILLRNCDVDAKYGTIDKGVPPERSVRVAKDGSGDFRTISEAVAAAPKANKSYFRITIEEGVYEEHVVVPADRPFLMFVGAGDDKTIISGKRSNKSGWSTHDSATVAIEGQNFVATGITFRNTAGRAGKQAVALRASADYLAFHRCSIEGYQDTLYVQQGRHFFSECKVSGTVDFIFGYAAAVFQNCTMVARKPLSGQVVTIAAHGQECGYDGPSPPPRTGIAIQRSRVVAQKGNVRTYLGRPWHGCARTAYVRCNLGASVDPAGWLPWHGKHVTYVEYGNVGLGARTNRRVRWSVRHKNAARAAKEFTMEYLLDGGDWLKKVPVPFVMGLN